MTTKELRAAAPGARFWYYADQDGFTAGFIASEVDDTALEDVGDLFSYGPFLIVTTRPDGPAGFTRDARGDFVPSPVGLKIPWQLVEAK